MNEPIYVTKEGLDNLKEELRGLKEEKIPEVAKRIQIARDNGDISENAEYDAAKHEQAVVEGRIKELEEIIKNAKVSDSAKSTDAIVVGSKVKVHIEGRDEVFHIVGAMEADPAKNKISHESPIGASLLGKKPGDSIAVEAPIGKVIYKIIAIS